MLSLFPALNGLLDDLPASNTFGYASFYNPVRLATTLLGRKTKVSQKAAGMQVVGMLGLIAVSGAFAGASVTAPPRRAP